MVEVDGIFHFHYMPLHSGQWYLPSSIIGGHGCFQLPCFKGQLKDVLSVVSVLGGRG